jgi:hypothetical protein
LRHVDGAGEPSGRRVTAEILGTALALLLSVSAAAAPCRNYRAAAAHAIKRPRVEREAADRLTGLDTRP